MKNVIEKHVQYMTEKYLKDDKSEYEDENKIESIDFESMFFNVGKAKELKFTEEDADPEELKLGIETEKEHTTNDEIAKKIALDHLAEIKDYYTRLKAMEDNAKSESSKKDEDLEDESSKELETPEEDNETPKDKTSKVVSFESLQSNKDLEFVNEDKYITIVKKHFNESKDYNSFFVDVDTKTKKFKSIYGCKELNPSKDSKFEKIV